MEASAGEGYAPHVLKRAQVQGLKESRLTISREGDQDFVASEEVKTSLVI